MTLVIDHRGLETAVALNRTLGVAVTRSLAEVEPIWRSIEADPTWASTPFQAFDWVAAFCRDAGHGREPALVTLSDENGRPGALLPLAVENRFGLRIARFIGGKHASFHAGLFDRTFAAKLTASELLAALRRAAASASGGIDVFHLSSQPERIDGIDNPFALLPHRGAPSSAHALALEADGEALFARIQSGPTRKKLRKKEKALAEMGVLGFHEPKDETETAAWTSLFIRLKGERLAERGIANPFAEPGMDAFIRRTVTGDQTIRPSIRFFALTLDDQPIALFAGTAARGRFSGMFNVIAPGPAMRESPGEVLLGRVIRKLCAEGFRVFDLGVGEARYKESLCDSVEPLFDQTIAVTLRGQAAGVVLDLFGETKRRVKQSEQLAGLVRHIGSLANKRGFGARKAQAASAGASA